MTVHNGAARGLFSGRGGGVGSGDSSEFFVGDKTGGTDVSTSLHNAVLANMDPTTGVSVVKFNPGKYALAWTVDTTTLINAGVTKIILQGAGKHATRFIATINNACIKFDMTSRASGPYTVSALSLQTFNTYNVLDRLSISTASTLFPKNSRGVIHSLDKPEYDIATGSRWVGEGFRVKDCDSSFVWPDERLEYAEMNGTSLYVTNLMAYKLSSELSLEVYDIGFYPNTPTEPVMTARNSNSVYIDCVMALDSFARRCHFEDPWFKSVWFKSCIDCWVEDSSGYGGVNDPNVSGKITYFLSVYGASYNCGIRNCEIIGYRHNITQDGNNSAGLTTNGGSAGFTTVNTSNQVTVNSNGHGLSANDFVRFYGTTTGNNITINGAYTVVSATTNSFVITAATNANASSSFGTNVAFAGYKISQAGEWGQPVNCGETGTISDGGRGAPGDSHVEGARGYHIGCKRSNSHSSDVVSPSGFIGADYQIRGRRVTIKDCYGYGGNGGINIKVSEHGTNNWVKIINTEIGDLTYVSDQGRGLYVQEETSGWTNKTRIILENFKSFRSGISIETDVGCIIEGDFKSIQPGRGHIQLADGTEMDCPNSYWDSNSANLPGASSANRTLFGVIAAGTVSCRLPGLTHKLGTDTAKHTPQLFEVSDAASGKTIKINGYKELDPAGIGMRTIIKPGQEADFTIEASDARNFVASFEGPSNKTYTMVYQVAFAGTIVNSYTKTTSGTATVTFKINSTALGGAANSASSSGDSVAQTSNNTFNAGDTITATISSNSAAVDLLCSLKYFPRA